MKTRKLGLDELKTEDECPGEVYCTTEPDGMCVQQHTTLERICNSREGVGCRLYFTKASSVPFEYEALLEAALRLKERSLNNLSINDEDLALYEIHALTVYNRAERVVDSKSRENDDDSPDQKGVPGRGFKKGDSSAFAFTDEQLREMYEQRRQVQEMKATKRKERTP